MRTVAPSRSITRSSGARVASKSNPYWNPEQPPPDTLTRSAVPAASPDNRRAIRFAARSDRETAAAPASITLDKEKTLSFLVLTRCIVMILTVDVNGGQLLLHRIKTKYLDSPMFSG